LVPEHVLRALVNPPFQWIRFSLWCNELSLVGCLCSPLFSQNSGKK
jgi:hypothetical protein